METHFREDTRRTTRQSLSKQEDKMDGMEADNTRAINTFIKGDGKTGEKRKKISRLHRRILR